MIELPGEAGQRLDQLLAAKLPAYSRARLQEWIRAGLVTVDAETRKASYVLRGGEQIIVQTSGSGDPISAPTGEHPRTRPAANEHQRGTATADGPREPNLSTSPQPPHAAPPNPSRTPIELPGEAGQRLDQLLAAKLPAYSRARLQEWIRAGLVTVDAETRKASYVLRGGEQIIVHPGVRPPLDKAVPEEIPLEILYEDDALVAVNKPAGMTVHAGAGVHAGTLVNALLHRYQQLSAVNGDDRPGIVHRLDRFTSGVILVARTDEAHRRLAAQFANRETEKIYLALVHGAMPAEKGRIDKPIARHPSQRHKMTTSDRGRAAWTEWRVLARYGKFTLLEVKIGTGRTHQIRVHLASLRHPVAGDTTYGAAPNPQAEAAGGRFFLHAARITFRHPVTNNALTVEAPLPPELQRWLMALPGE